MPHSLITFLFFACASGILAQGIKLERDSHPLNPLDEKNNDSAHTEELLIPVKGVSALTKQKQQLEAALKRFPPLKSQISPPKSHFGYMSKRRTISATTPPINEWVELIINKTNPIQLESIALIPAFFPEYSSEGNYGFPKRFKIDVFTQKDQTAAITIVDWTEQDFPDPGLHPVLFKLPNIPIQKIRLTVTRGMREGAVEFYALNELMLFRGGPNMALSLLDSLHVSSSAQATPYWHKNYLLDRSTHLGEPIHTSNQSSDFIQYFNTQPQEGKKPEILIDLGSVQSVGRVELYSAKIPKLPIPPIPLPTQYRIELLDTPEQTKETRTALLSSNQANNNRWHALFSQDGRYLRITIDELSNQQNQAVLAFGEIRVINDNESFLGNLAEGKKVTLKNFPHNHQSDPKTLVDGYTNGKKIIPEKLYIEQIAKRQLVENALSNVSERLIVARAIREQRYWTIGIASAVTAVFGYILTIIYQNSKRRKTVLAVQQQIAADLHDDISGNLGTISMISNRLQNNSDQTLTQEKLREIKHLAQESFVSVKEIIWHTDAEALHFSDLFQQIKRTARSILSACHIIYQFPEIYDDLEVPIETRRNVMLLIKESLYNCAKYAEANTVNIRADIHDSLLELCMQDDGCGFDSTCDESADSQSGRGLENMKRRANLLGAELSIHSAIGKGTKITLTMPIKPH